jgi:hypothetical protein
VSTAKQVWLGIAGLLVIIAIPIVVWIVNVASSGVVGQGNAIIQKNSAENWTKAQGEFESIYAEIEATDRKITAAKTALDLDPEDLTAKQTYTGTQNVCLSMVADYNAKARNYLAAEFRAVDLPAQIDAMNPNTDCQE